MSKKKTAKKIPSKKSLTAKVSDPNHSVIPSKPKPESSKLGFELVRFDKKVWLFILTCSVLFFLCVALKWNYASIGRWNEIAKDGGDLKRGIITGTPKKIRSDEWMVTSSFTLAQHSEGFPVSNEALGEGKVPLLMGLPTTKLVSKIRPSLWGYYLLDIERGFSWYWNFKIFPFLISSFLFLMLFTKNKYLLSLFGSVWLLMSSAMLWWSIATEPFTYGFICIISLIYIIYHNNLKIIFLNSLLFLISAYSFLMILYPAWLIPIIYMLIFLIIGYLINNKENQKTALKNQIVFKLTSFGVALILLVVLGYLFFTEIRETYQIMAETVYPGKRMETGGNFAFIKMFTENFSLFTDMTNFPSNWINICELSSFLMLSPFASIIIIADFIKSRKINPLLLVFLVFQIVMLIWILIGLPSFLAKWTLLNMSPAWRTIFVYGFANVLATILFFAHHKSLIIKNNIITKVVSLVILFVISITINYFLNKQSDFYFSSTQLWIATALFAILTWLTIYYSSSRIYQIAFYVLCFLFLIPNFKINPINDGLSSYYENKLFRVVSEIEDMDPDRGWVVYGSFIYASYLKAAGINSFNGAKFVPHIDKMHILDTYHSRDSIYNRYSHITFGSYIYRDSVHFTLHSPDTYSIHMDPCSPRFHELEIKYFLFTYKPEPDQVRCMTLMMEDNFNRFVYKRNDL